MKKQLISFLVVLSCVIFVINTSMAQVPQAISYQGVVRHPFGKSMANRDIDLIMSIHKDGPSGSIVYEEKTSIVTNQYSLFTHAIGTGIPMIGNFSDITWSTKNHWLEVKADIIDFENGFVSLGTTQLLSVPYALYAETSGHGGGPTGPTGSNGSVGANGVNGTNGLNGVTGNTGLQGPIGPTGSQGIAGINGINGNTGA